MIAQTIQLALAPVFVLVAIGNILNILSMRLARIVDRSRVMVERHAETEGPEHDEAVREIRLLDRRIDIIGQAIFTLVVSGLFIGATVTLLFVEEFLAIDLQRYAAGLFLLAIVLMMWSMLLFLRETRLVSATVRIPERFLERDREI